MYVVEHMQTFEVLSIIIGLITGVTAAALPSAFDEKRSQGPVWAFAFAVGAFVGILPIAAVAPEFPAVLVCTLIAAFIGWFAVNQHRNETAKATAEPKDILLKQETPVTRNRAA